MYGHLLPCQNSKSFDNFECTLRILYELLKNVVLNQKSHVKFEKINLFYFLKLKNIGSLLILKSSQ